MEYKFGDLVEVKEYDEPFVFLKHLEGHELYQYVLAHKDYGSDWYREEQVIGLWKDKREKLKENKMKKIMTVTEIQGEGLLKLLGETVTLFCLNYIYTGILEGVNETCVLLKDAKIVYETGELTSKKWTDAQKLPNDWYVQIGAIESFGILKK